MIFHHCIYKLCMQQSNHRKHVQVLPFTAAQSCPKLPKAATRPYKDPAKKCLVVYITRKIKDIIYFPNFFPKVGWN